MPELLKADSTDYNADGAHCETVSVSVGKAFPYQNPPVLVHLLERGKDAYTISVPYELLPWFMELRSVVRNYELLLKESWETLAEVCEYSGDPEYSLDIEDMRQLMVRIDQRRSR